MMLRNNKRYFALVLVFFLLPFFMLSSCSNKQSKKIQFQSIPLYKEYVSIDTTNILKGLQQLDEKYPDFFGFYIDTVLGLNTQGHLEKAKPALTSLLTFKDYRHLFDTVLKVFPNTEHQDFALAKAFNNISTLDTAFVIPTKVYYLITYLRQSAFTYKDTILGIGLDMFLGKSFKPYRSPDVNIPDYMLTKFTKENIPVWACRAIYNNQRPFLVKNKNLLGLMIEKGKEIYFLKKALPDIPERLLFGFTKDQMTWCQNNEAAIYNYIIKHQLIYATRLRKIMPFVQNGPGIPGFPTDAPANLGTFIGWKIVTHYAENTGGSLESILQTKNPNHILKKARYKP